MKTHNQTPSEKKMRQLLETVSPLRYEFAHDGLNFVAKNQHDFVKQLRTAAFHPTKDLEDYMFQFSERALFALHVVVRYDTPENFVEDLLRHNIIDVFLLN